MGQQVLKYVLPAICFLATMSRLALAAPSSSLTSAHGNGTELASGPPLTKPIRDMECYDTLGRPYIELVPHPNACNLYLQCIQNGVEFNAMQRPCQQTYLEFSMKTCRCENPGTPEAECFDSSNPEHLLNRLKCATLVELDPSSH